jgi:hypothetical protein
MAMQTSELPTSIDLNGSVVVTDDILNHNQSNHGDINHDHDHTIDPYPSNGFDVHGDDSDGIYVYVDHDGHDAVTSTTTLDTRNDQHYAPLAESPTSIQATSATTTTSFVMPSLSLSTTTTTTTTTAQQEQEQEQEDPTSTPLTTSLSLDIERLREMFAPQPALPTFCDALGQKLIQFDDIIDEVIDDYDPMSSGSAVTYNSSDNSSRSSNNNNAALYDSYSSTLANGLDQYAIDPNRPSTSSTAIGINNFNSSIATTTTTTTNSADRSPAKATVQRSSVSYTDPSHLLPSPSPSPSSDSILQTRRRRHRILTATTDATQITHDMFGFAWEGVDRDRKLIQRGILPALTSDEETQWLAMLARWRKARAELSAAQLAAFSAITFPDTPTLANTLADSDASLQAMLECLDIRERIRKFGIPHRFRRKVSWLVI